jgi:hypothetical protein
MKIIRCAAGAAAAIALLFSMPALAQVSKDGMGKVVPVEIFACKYNAGKGPADLDKVVARWNKFMDDNGVDNYAAWTLTPYYFGSEQDFDVLWLGASADGNAMGSGTQLWTSKGGDIQKAYNEVVKCNGHSGMSSAMYKAPAGGNTPASGVITMMDCKLNEGHRYADIQAAEVKWAAHLTSVGSKAAYYHWFPVFGGGDAEFDYKVVFSFPDFLALGADWERNANGGGREMSRDIFDDIDDCDDARVYIAQNRRAGKIR